MRISDWSSDVCSSDLVAPMRLIGLRGQPHLHRADHAPVHLRHRENDASLAYAADNIPPIGLAVLRPERQHETQRCAAIDAIGERSEEGRVGKEGVSTGRSWGSTYE